MEMPDDLQGEQIDQGMLDAAYRAVREHANKSIYGRYISDAECRSVANEVMIAIEDYRSGKVI
jgi:hypothetical protein